MVFSREASYLWHAPKVARKRFDGLLQTASLHHFQRMGTSPLKVTRETPTVQSAALPRVHYIGP